MNWTQRPNGVVFSVKVLPRAKRDEIAGVEAGTLKVRVNASPIEGKANSALVKLLADALGVRQADIEIIRGANRRTKTVLVVNVSGSDLARLFRP